MEAGHAADEAQRSDKFRISMGDVEPPSPVLRWAYRLFACETGRQGVRVCIVVVCVLAVLSVVTGLEGRFSCGSVVAPLAGYGNVLGMSFLGDTMVWPYTLLVPLCLVLTRSAFRRTVVLLNEVAEVASDEWRDDRTELGCADELRKAKEILGFRHGWRTLVLRVLAWSVALTFWSYNSTTCALHPWLPDRAYPYASDEVVVLSNPDVPPTALRAGTTLPAKIKLPRPIHLPKWDCDLANAPLSCVATRLWCLAFYGIIPFLFSHLIVMIWAVCSFLRATRHWSQDKDVETSTLRIESFAKDNFGGLGYLTDAGMSYLYVISAVLTLLAMSLIKEGQATPAWHDCFMLAAFVPLAIVVFLLPTFLLRRSIVAAKSSCLSRLSTDLNRLTAEVQESCRPGCPSDVARSTSLYYHLSSLKAVYDHVQGMAEWPLTASVFVRMGLSLGFPIVIVILEKVLLKSLGG